MDPTWRKNSSSVWSMDYRSISIGSIVYMTPAGSWFDTGTVTMSKSGLLNLFTYIVCVLRKRHSKLFWSDTGEWEKRTCHG